MFRKAFTITLPKGNGGQGSSIGPKSNQPCFNCNPLGHWSKECPHPKKNNNQNHRNQRQSNSKARPGYVHYTIIEEVPVGEVVTAGMFLVNKHPAIVLFDSGASHSFMSQAFASRHDQKVIEVSKGGYSISSAGATISTNKMVRNVLISIQEREYTMDLIVLPGLSIDVILGMRWMSDYGVVIDTSACTIMLREPKGGNAFLVPLSQNFELQHLVCSIQTTTLSLCYPNHYPL